MCSCSFVVAVLVVVVVVVIIIIIIVLLLLFLLLLLFFVVVVAAAATFSLDPSPSTQYHFVLYQNKDKHQTHPLFDALISCVVERTNAASNVAKKV